VFNRVEIRRIGRPFHAFYRIITQPIIGFLGCMDACVILHEYKVRIINSRQYLFQNIKIGVRRIAMFL
jgi:hypothetical protein